ncbi:MAG TPA: hypothetical protein VIC32_01030 [Terriglobales bacterium]
MLHWVLLTGEYPPERGGVADYSGQLAAGLRAAGDEVTIWAPGYSLPDHWGRRSFRKLQADMRAGEGGGARWLIQYVPHAYGKRAMNYRFCRWVYARRQLHPWVMFHEVAYPREAGQGWRLRLLAEVTRRMARQLQRASARSFISNQRWDLTLEEMAPGTVARQWLPVPSNLPDTVAAERVAALRHKYGNERGAILASFCPHSPFARAHLTSAAKALLAVDRGRTLLLVGAGSDELRRAIAAAAPKMAAQVHSVGYAMGAEAAEHLAAADLLLQLYADGVSGRRGSVMAGLALGRPVLTNEGASTEALWRDSRAVALTTPGDLVPTVELWLGDAAERAALGRAGREFYTAHFSIEHTINALRKAALDERLRKKEPA